MNGLITFNLESSSPEDLLKVGEQPYQIMPATIRYLTSSSINKFKHKNPLSIIHMNYITRPFKVVEATAQKKLSLENYKLLAKHIGTENILIHLPESDTEYETLEKGMKLIYGELLKEIRVHFEIPVFAASLINKLNLRNSPKTIIEGYIDNCFNEIRKYVAEPLLVIDTAHLWGNGLNANEITEIIEKYNANIEIIHLNGNCKEQFKKDTHVPFYDEGLNLIKGFDSILEIVKKYDYVCICEDKNYKNNYDQYAEIAKKNGMEIIKLDF